MRKSLTRQVLAAIGVAFTAVLSFIVAVVPAGAMTVTFVRHGESEGNASGLIDTKVPGPPLTGSPDDAPNPDTGWGQSKLVAVDLAGEEHDGIYASTMVRTQQTAKPLAALLYHSGVLGDVTISKDPYHPDYGDDIVVLNGLQEISAGIFEGSSEDEGLGRIGYIAAPVAWTLGLRFVRIPGSEDGNEFDARVDAALDQIENEGDSEDPVVFSHGATIMFWTLMNVDNPDLTLLLTDQLDNTDTVVVEKNDDGSWTLKKWGDKEVGEATLPTQLFVNVRDLIVAPQTALYNLSHNTSAGTAAQGGQDVGNAAQKFATNTVEDLGKAVQEAPAALKNSSAAKLTEKANGATDLTAGNKVMPGDRLAAAISKNNDRVNEAVQDVKDEIASSIKKVGETVKKVADAAKEAADDAKKDAAEGAKKDAA